jgi:gamma-glutamyltranspeptidase / glutathione hydrolase
MERETNNYTFAAAAGTPYAAAAAAEVYRAGGNAADAAAAAGAAVSVTEPLMSSVGGGGFALVKTPGGHAELLDYFDVMPGKGLPPSAFGANGNPQAVMLKYGAGVRSVVGAASSAVPGAFRGLETLVRRHGRLSLGQVLAPAARLARDGFRLCRTSGMWFSVAEEVINLTEETRSNFTRDGNVYKEGDWVSFPDLADTLAAVGEEGADLLYRGELGRRVASYMQEMGGIITERDLREYEVVVRRPMSVVYRQGEMYTNGPPSAGGSTLAQMLKVVSGYDLASLTREDFVAVMSGAMRYALADRMTKYGDAGENARVAERLTSEEYVIGQRERIYQAFGSPHTTHLSCVDDEGLAVSITASMGYGSGIVVPGTGIPMNNTLGEPELNPTGFHALEPGQRLVSNMSPTVVSSREGGLVSLGSPGASRIPTAILQTIVNVIDFGMPMESAVLAPRFHAEDDLFAYEAGAPKIRWGERTEMLAYDEPSMFFGGVNAVRRTPEGLFEASADPRRSGGVAFA